jgi:hypothetical protein
MMIRRQNSYAHGGKQRTGRREAQSRELIKLLKIFPVLGSLLSIWLSTEEDTREPVSRRAATGTTGCTLASSHKSATKKCRSPLMFPWQVWCCFIGAENVMHWLCLQTDYKNILSFIILKM